MASILSRLKNYISSTAQKTHLDYNKAIYNYLGESILWNSATDDTYIDKGYRTNSTVYSIVNLIAKAATTIPFQVYEIVNENDVLSKLIETSISKDKPIVVSDKNNQKIGVISQSDLLRAVVEGNENE